LTCELFGSNDLIDSLDKNLDKKKIRVVRAPCMGLCDKAPACEVGHKHLGNANLKKVKEIISSKNLHPEIIKGKSLEDYIKDNGYELLNKCYQGELNVDEIIEELNLSGLKGMGGAGFPSGQKWKFVRMEKGPRLMTINGDEGEPGTFKDKLYLEQNMHKFFEGMLIAAWAVEAKDIYIYMRDEYPGIRLKMIKELEKLKETNIIDNKINAINLKSLKVFAGTGEPQRADMTLDVFGEVKKTSQTGDGPVDAIFKCIKELYPHDVKLSLYQVHAVTEGTDAQATVSVKIEENDRTTVGQSADTDTLVASANAYLNALNKMLIKREKKSLYKNIEPKKLKESI